MLFSVLVPVYNVEKYIRKSIESVIMQTFGEFELILVDDGSTDKSGLICDEYASKDSRIRVIHNNNHGLLYTRRAAFAEAKGEYCVIMDSDDQIKHNTLQVLYETIMKYESDCIVFGLEKVLNGQIIDTITEPDTAHLTNKRDIYMRVFLDAKYNPICRKCFKKALLDGRDYSTFYHLSLREDLLQSIEILQNANNVTFIPDVLYEYTMNPQSMTHTKKASNYIIDTSIRSIVFDFLSECRDLSTDDLFTYITYCLFLLCIEIKTIAMFDCTYKKKKELLSELYSEEYYQQIMKKGRHGFRNGLRNYILLCFFKHKQFGLIAMSGEIYNIIHGQE